MPATPFEVDLSQPGKGVSIRTSGPNQIIISEENLYKERGASSLATHYRRTGWLTIETIVVKTKEGMMEYHILQGPEKAD